MSTLIPSVRVNFFVRYYTSAWGGRYAGGGSTDGRPIVHRRRKSSVHEGAGCAGQNPSQKLLQITTRWPAFFLFFCIGQNTRQTE